MAKLLQASVKFGPKLVLKDMVGLKDVAERVADHTSSNKSEVLMHLSEESSAILYFIKYGMPIKLPGVGIFTPSIDREGEISINFRADPELKREINKEGVYCGEITNRENIGITNEKYKELWDAEFPANPLEI